MEGYTQIASGLFTHRPGELIRQHHWILHYAIAALRMAPMTKQCTCRGLRITDKSPCKLFRTRRLESFGQLTAGQIFVNRHAFALGAEQFANDMFHGLVVGSKDRVSQQFSNLCLQWRDEL